MFNNDLLCPVIIGQEELDMSMMRRELKALKEQEQEAELLPDATAMYLMDKKEWLEYELLKFNTIILTKDVCLEIK